MDDVDAKSPQRHLKDKQPAVTTSSAESHHHPLVSYVATSFRAASSVIAGRKTRQCDCIAVDFGRQQHWRDGARMGERIWIDIRVSDGRVSSSRNGIKMFGSRSVRKLPPSREATMRREGWRKGLEDSVVSTSACIRGGSRGEATSESRGARKMVRE